MFDTIVYIPTILAYAFISLLVVILCFIVIYVSHKIYISVYDNLPISNSVFSTIFSEDSARNMKADKRSTDKLTLPRHESMASRKSKTVFEKRKQTLPSALIDPHSVSDIQNNVDDVQRFAEQYQQSSQVGERNCFVRYFDRLSMIPMEKTQTACCRIHAMSKLHRDAHTIRITMGEFE